MIRSASVGLGKWENLVPVHGHALAIAAELPVRGGRDGPAAGVANSAGFFECKQLLGAEGLVVDLGSSFDQVLQVSACEEVAEIDEFAVVLVLDWM